MDPATEPTKATNIVSLRGDAIKDVREPDPAVIKRLEELLEMARAGELIGLIGAYLYYDMCTSGFSPGFQSYALIGRLEAVKQHSLGILDQ